MEPKKEGQKLFFDAFKHLTTLSTGAIVILAALVKDVLKTREWVALVGVTFGSLLVSVIGSVFVMMALAYAVVHGDEAADNMSSLIGIGVLVSSLGFLLGIGTLVVFALKNLY